LTTFSTSVPAQAPSVSDNHARHRLWTVAAIASIAALLTIEDHELGHALAGYLYGVRHFYLSVYFLGEPYPQGVGVKWLNASGTIVNIVQGFFAYCLFRTVRGRASVSWTYFLWLFATLNFLMGSSYPLYSAVTGNGDWATFFRDWHHPSLMNGLMGVCSVVTYGIFTYFLAKDLAMFSDNLFVLTLTPYFTSIVIACAASLLGRLGPSITLVGALPATSIGFASLTFMAPWAKRLRGNATAIEMIQASHIWMLSGGVAAVVFLVIGHGIEWSTH